VAATSPKTRSARLRRIEAALKAAVPNLEALTYLEERGVPHLEAVDRHWRPNAGKQREEQFSDGTLRLIGLLWSLLEGESLLLLEEPELSLNSAIVRRLPGMIRSMQRTKGRQVLISTHSPDLLSDPGIGGEEILLLTPVREGTEVHLPSEKREIRALLEAGMTVADAVLPLADPPAVKQLPLFTAP
jgi:predicted ATPase